MPTLSTDVVSAAGVTVAGSRRCFGPSSNQDPAHALSPDDCRWLLTTDRLGRISYTAAALPAVAPVTYFTRGADVIIRVEASHGVVASIDGQVVALQVDQLDKERLDGWQVTVTGVARLDPSDGGARTLRLTSPIITGRTVQLA